MDIHTQRKSFHQFELHVNLAGDLCTLLYYDFTSSEYPNTRPWLLTTRQTAPRVIQTSCTTENFYTCT